MIQEVSTKPSESVLSKIQEKLDTIDGLFVSPKHLHQFGLFGSHSAAVNALKSGAMPHLRVSPYRILVEKKAVLDFIKERFHARKAAN